MSVRLTLICHAATQAVRVAAFPADEPIDKQGEAKAATLSLALPNELRKIDVGTHQSFVASQTNSGGAAT